jgi:2-polyprenyl-6-methoxyphenol hydroxylase-like FAD-dependent oxidoreductase
MKLEALHVAVVGGAIGGAGAALLLARAGARVTLLERAEGPTAAGAGIALAENGLSVLEALGFDGELARISSALPGVRVVDANKRPLFLPVGGTPGQPPNMRMARRADLHRLLTEALVAEQRIDARYGVDVREASEDGTVRGSLAGKPFILRADLVVGADGVHSRVRDAAALGARVSRPGIAYVRGLGPEGLAQNEEAWTAAGLFGSFAVPGGTYWYASLGTPALRRARETRELPLLRAAWAAAYPPSRALLESVQQFDELLINEVVRVRCARFAHGRRVLIGDAAHAMAPNLGQGANSALVDGAVLLDALRGADTLEHALAAYDARRRPKVERVAATAARLGRLAELTNPVVRFVRDRVLMPLAALGDGSAMMRTVWQEAPSELAMMARPSAT